MFRNLFEDNDFSATIPLHARVQPPFPCSPAPCSSAPLPPLLVAYICIVISAFYVSPDCCGDLPFVVEMETGSESGGAANWIR